SSTRITVRCEASRRARFSYSRRSRSAVITRRYCGRATAGRQTACRTAIVQAAYEIVHARATRARGKAREPGILYARALGRSQGSVHGLHRETEAGLRRHLGIKSARGLTRKFSEMSIFENLRKG